MVTHNSESDLPLAILLEHRHSKFDINMTKIKGGCHLGRKVVTHNSKCDSPLAYVQKYLFCQKFHPVYLDLISDCEVFFKNADA